VLLPKTETEQTERAPKTHRAGRSEQPTPPHTPRPRHGAKLERAPHSNRSENAPTNIQKSTTTEPGIVEVTTTLQTNAFWRL